MEFRFGRGVYEPWHLWFAWYPVVVYRSKNRQNRKKKIVWLENVWREKVVDCNEYYRIYRYRSARLWRVDPNDDKRLVMRNDVPLSMYDWES